MQCAKLDSLCMNAIPLVVGLLLEPWNSLGIGRYYLDQYQLQIPLQANQPVDKPAFTVTSDSYSIEIIMQPVMGYTAISNWQYILESKIKTPATNNSNNLKDYRCCVNVDTYLQVEWLRSAEKILLFMHLV